ncbi:MAG: hypothetical protein IPF87_13520 [Gemmatimonadetes bacterium]|nr:hypothetical protein [Gemmatimonadota bacterium]
MRDAPDGKGRKATEQDTGLPGVPKDLGGIAQGPVVLHLAPLGSTGDPSVVVVRHRGTEGKGAEHRGVAATEEDAVRCNPARGIATGLCDERGGERERQRGGERYARHRCGAEGSKGAMNGHPCTMPRVDPSRH